MGDAPVWKGTGERLKWRAWAQHWHLQLPGNQDVFAAHRTATFVAPDLRTEVRLAESNQAALDALHARLCEQHDALGRVTGRGTVEDVVAWLQIVAGREQLAAWDAARKKDMDTNRIAVIRYQLASNIADRIARGEHLRREDGKNCPYCQGQRDMLAKALRVARGYVRDCAQQRRRPFTAGQLAAAEIVLERLRGLRPGEERDG